MIVIAKVIDVVVKIAIVEIPRGGGPPDDNNNDDNDNNDDVDDSNVDNGWW